MISRRGFFGTLTAGVLALRNIRPAEAPDLSTVQAAIDRGVTSRHEAERIQATETSVWIAPAGTRFPTLDEIPTLDWKRIA